MTETVTIDQLRAHLEIAKDKLSLEKEKILELHPLAGDFSREEYAFSYVRAERVGMRVINRRLAEIAWLPMQLDPRSEILSEGRSSMKRWLSSPIARAPDSDEFGNDFMHALTRCGLQKGFENPSFIRLAARVANLFRDLSCLIGLIYYCTWMSENNIEAVELSDPSDVERTAEEIAGLLQSPEIYRYLKAQEQNDEKVSRRKKPAIEKPKKKERPNLRVIKNTEYLDPFMPDPVTV
ncbi:MAG TPA: hypothetical protein VFR09_06170 [Alphaproteobacteria bacterium]|nr:hypothetical protein [Alphaproteobacteria bacterium]